MFDKKQKSCVKRIHLVTDDSLSDWKAFNTVKIIFIHPLWMMANLSTINIWMISRINNIVKVQQFKWNLNWLTLTYICVKITGFY